MISNVNVWQTIVCYPFLRYVFLFCFVVDSDAVLLCNFIQKKKQSRPLNGAPIYSPSIIAVCLSSRDVEKKKNAVVLNLCGDDDDGIDKDDDNDYHAMLFFSDMIQGRSKCIGHTYYAHQATLTVYNFVAISFAGDGDQRTSKASASSTWHIVQQNTNHKQNRNRKKQRTNTKREREREI